MKRKVKIEITMEADFPDCWYKSKDSENDSNGDNVLDFWFNEKCCMYDHVIGLLKARRDEWQSKYPKNECSCGQDNPDEFSIEVIGG